MEYQVHPNEGIFIRLQLARTDTGLFPQTKIYAIDAPSTVVDTVNLAEVSNGLYGLEWTNNGERKKYFTQTIVYTNSGHTSVHPIIRPDSDSINVGFNASGFSVNTLGSGVTRRVELTNEEIKRIAKAVLKILKPELDKKSEFDPEKDIVKTDIVIPEIPKIPEFPELPHVPSASEVARVVANTLDIDNKIKSIKFPEPEKFPTVPSLLQIVGAVDEVVREAVSDNVVDYGSLLNNINDKMGRLPDHFRSVVTQMDESVIQPIINSKESSDDMLEAVSALIVKKTKDELSKGVKKEDVINMIRSGKNEYRIFKVFKQLPLNDKKIIFNTLAKKNLPLLKRLAVIAKTYA